MRIKTHTNQLVNLTLKSKLGFNNTISGHVSAVGKSYLLLVDSDKKEHSFLKENIVSCKVIKPKTCVK